MVRILLFLKALNDINCLISRLDTVAEEMAGLAVATGALLRAERALFSPTLTHLLREPGRAAAATLYTLYGQRLQPWLAKSENLYSSFPADPQHIQALLNSAGTPCAPSAYGPGLPKVHLSVQLSSRPLLGDFSCPPALPNDYQSLRISV